MNISERERVLLREPRAVMVLAAIVVVCGTGPRILRMNPFFRVNNTPP